MQGDDTHYIYIFNRLDRKGDARYDTNLDSLVRVHGQDLLLDPSKRDIWPSREALKQHALACVLSNLSGAGAPEELVESDDTEQEPFESTISKETIEEYLKKYPATKEFSKEFEENITTNVNIK